MAKYTFNIIRTNGAGFTLFAFDGIFAGKKKNDFLDISEINGELRVYWCGCSYKYEVFHTMATAKNYVNKEITQYLADLYNIPTDSVLINYVDKVARRRK